MIVSSTEPPAFHPLGELGTLPEKYGVDFLWHDRGWCGVQRKEVKDFAASLRDGRLARELEQMEPLRAKLLVLEGTRFPEGAHMRVTRSTHDPGVPIAQWTSALWMLQQRGVWLTDTTSMTETRDIVRLFEAWTGKEVHTALGGTRATVAKNNWGRADHRAFQIHMLTGLPGVGEDLAARIVEHFGRVPWSMDVTEEELCQVDGIGKVRARRMIEALG